MSTIVLVFAIAVVLWAVISVVVVVAFQGRQTKQQLPEAQASNAVAVPAEEEQEPEPQLGRYLPPASDDLTWQQQLEQLPGVLGWILVRADGVVLEASDEDSEEMGPTLSRMLSSIGQMSEDLGVTPLQLMEWEGPQGSVLVAFPEDPELETYLVLFLDTETYKNQMRDLLSQLHWESNLKGAHHE